MISKVHFGLGLRFLPVSPFQRLTFPDIPAYRVTGPISVSFLLNILGPGSQAWQFSSGVHCFLLADYAANVEQFLAVYSISGGTATLTVQRSSGAGNRPSVAANLIVGQLYSIIFTSHPTGNKLYINGVLTSTSAGTNTMTTLGSTGIQMGNTGFNGNSNLMLSKFTFFNRELTGSEAAQMGSQFGFIPYSAMGNLVLHAPFDQRQGTTVKDFSPQKNSGVLTNFTAAQTTPGPSNQWVEAQSLQPILY